MKVLLEAPGINVNAKNKHGFTSLHVVIERGHENMVKILLSDPRINVNAQANGGWTPLHCAVGYIMVVEIVKALLNTPGINANSRLDDGRSPLDIATFYARSGVKLDGESPLYLGSTRHKEVIKILKNLPSGTKGVFFRLCPQRRYMIFKN